MGVLAYTSQMTYPALPFPQAVNRTFAWQPISQSLYPQDDWQPVDANASNGPVLKDAFQNPAVIQEGQKRKAGLIRPLEPGQEIPENIRRGLNPLQVAGVWMIENLYQKVGLKQDVWGFMEQNGLAVCPYTRRAKQEGIKGWQGCSQYTKMAIVRDGFFIGCFEGGVRMLTEPFVFLFNTPQMERYIERHARIILSEDGQAFQIDSPNSQSH